MHFQNYILQKTLLDKCLKSPIADHRWTVNMAKGTNTTEVCMEPVLSYFLINSREITLEMVFLGDI